MMKRTYHIGVGAIALSLLLNLDLVQGQEQPSRRGRAEKLYNKYEYANAARVYETLVDTKKPSTVDMERLAHSYYYIKEYGLAENWYARIVERSDADKQSFL
ncbi:OmpA family protein, partial [Parapusillimonas sp. SGNA-6]|nr:OmpA family protein [Parapusillimonas sp. SGNA-6]